MLVKSYRMEIFNNECMPGAMTVQCFAHLEGDVGPALPYLNTVQGGFDYIKEPPSITFRAQGKLMTVHSNKIAVNALKDENEAVKIVEWLIREINAAWVGRADIEPSYTGLPRIELIEVLKLLPRTNCGECGCPTCMVFASQVTEGGKDASHCPQMEPEKAARLMAYIQPVQPG